MNKVELLDLVCDCDGLAGVGELDTKTKEHTCLRCGSVCYE